MTKSELIKKLAKQESISLKDAEMVVNSVLDDISEALTNRKRVELRGLGVFQVHHRPQRQAKNPRTGEKVTVQAQNVATFKTGKNLKEALNASTVK